LNAECVLQHHHAEIRAQAIKKMAEIDWSRCTFSTSVVFDRQRDEAGGFGQQTSSRRIT